MPWICTQHAKSLIQRPYVLWCHAISRIFYIFLFFRVCHSKILHMCGVTVPMCRTEIGAVKRHDTRINSICQLVRVHLYILSFLKTYVGRYYVMCGVCIVDFADDFMQFLNQLWMSIGCFVCKKFSFVVSSRPVFLVFISLRQSDINIQHVVGNLIV